MKSRLYCNPARRQRATKLCGLLLAGCMVVCVFAFVSRAAAGGDAPQWMHALVNAPLPSYDEKTDTVLLYSETIVTVVTTDKTRTQVREAYKILRPNGRYHGTLFVYFNPQRKIKSLRGWCIPAQRKAYD